MVGSPAVALAAATGAPARQRERRPRRLQRIRGAGFHAMKSLLPQTA
jgi:hypothetical protein